MSEVRRTHGAVIRWATYFLLSSVLAAACLAARSQELEKPERLKDFIAKLDEPVIVRGDFLKAINAAYTLDFALAFLKQAPSPADASTEKVWFSIIEDYDIAVQMEGGHYLVSFFRTLRGDAPDSFGGGAKYVVDGRTFQLLSKTYTKCFCRSIREASELRTHRQV